MKRIPIKLREEMERDMYYKRCCVSGRTDEKIDYHHNLIFAGSQVNRKWCILPLAKSIHDDIVKYKEICDWIMLNRASDTELREFSKAIDYVQMKKRLNEKFGKYKNFKDGTK